MKRVFIQAYLALNLGDDLFLKILSERYPKTFFEVFNSSIYEKLNISKYGNIKSIPKKKVKDKIFKFLKISKSITRDETIKKMDCIVDIGGSIFIERENGNISDLRRREKDIKLNKNYFILGANFGPYLTEKYKDLHYNFFQKCNDVCFRENNSFELFKKLKNVRKASDIVFNLKIHEGKEDYILISVIKPSNKIHLAGKEKEYYISIKNLIVELLRKGKRIKLMSFCKFEGDEEAIEQIMSMLDEKDRKRVECFYYNGNIDEALTVISNSEIVVASRFHAMILGFIHRKKVFPIIYSKKMLNVLEDMKFNGEYCDFDTLEKLNIFNILKNEKLKEEILKELIKDSEQQFRVLDTYLEKY